MLRFVLVCAMLIFSLLFLLPASKQRSTTLISCIQKTTYLALYSLHIATPIDELLLQDSKECYPCSVLASCEKIVVQRTCIRPIACRKPLKLI